MKYFRFAICILILLFIKSSICIAQPLDFVKNTKKNQSESDINDKNVKNIINEEEMITISSSSNITEVDNEKEKSNTKLPNILAYRHKVAQDAEYEYCLFYIDEKLYKEFNDLKKGCCYARYYDDFDYAIDVVFYDGEKEWHTIFEKDFPSSNIIKHGNDGERNVFYECDINEALKALKKNDDKNLLNLLEYNEKDRKKSPLYIVDKLSDEGFMSSGMSIQETKAYVAFYMCGQIEYPNGFISVAQSNYHRSFKHEDEYKISCNINYDYKTGNYSIKDDVEIVDSNGMKKICTAEATINLENKTIEKFKVY